MLAENVIKLKETNLYDDIMAYFDELDNQVLNDDRYKKNNKQEKSPTRISYEKNIREFFRIVLNKEIEHLIIHDLDLKKRDIISYRKQLLDNGNANGTVNQKLSSVKSLFNFLSAEYELNTAIFNLKRLKDNPNSYGHLSQTEAERFAEVAFETEREKPYAKKMLILFAIRSSFRIDVILNIKWRDFEYVDGVYKVTGIGKGNKINTNSISAKLYEQILVLKELNKQTKWNGDPELVFQITEDPINKMMKRLRERLGIPKERNIVFHSFRKVAIDWELEMTGNVKSAALQGNHSNIDTMWKHYVNKQRDFSQTPGVRMEQEIDLSFLDSLTVDDFKDFIRQGNYKLHVEIHNYFKKKHEN
ncbi:tyrosine-type recombinase/integrase [Bacillus sp. T33-2]|uniref:tyrosine-type recombinase/integrase n=1 Tax=Bacillus sp. T33-2 TaxID=2054168 RepID=UPI000C75E86C|nr:tyrosine-type recombinase/integrase [Bacillus sp. T33-2]PLR99551.1 hypothetical protein CVD19_00375 [Bacillus sp. T33-2]